MQKKILPNLHPSIIFLNGASSSGKSSLAKILQNKLEKPYLHVGIDKVIGMMPEKLNDWERYDVSKSGFFWQKSFDKDGNKLMYINSGSYAKKITYLLKELTLTILKNGHNVILDEVCLDSSDFKEWKNILSDYNVLYVGLVCDTSILEKREIKRGDRTIGSARAQNRVIHQDKLYNFKLDVSNLKITECADKIVALVKNKMEK